jgi:hypothetical protein
MHNLSTKYDLLDELCYPYRVVRYWDSRRFRIEMKGPKLHSREPVWHVSTPPMYLPPRRDITENWVRKLLAHPDLLPKHGPYTTPNGSICRYARQ